MFLLHKIEAMYRRIVAEQAIKARHNAQKNADKPRYEYDSDEEIDGGTWEHKKRKKEMEKTIGNVLIILELILPVLYVHISWHQSFKQGKINKILITAR